jgi:hypothetical protein
VFIAKLGMETPGQVAKVWEEARTQHACVLIHCTDFRSVTISARIDGTQPAAAAALAAITRRLQQHMGERSAAAAPPPLHTHPSRQRSTDKQTTLAQPTTVSPPD